MRIEKQTKVTVFDGKQFDSEEEAIAYCKANSDVYAFEFHYNANIDGESAMRSKGYVLVVQPNAPYVEPIYSAEYWAYENYGNRIYYDNWGYGDPRPRWILEKIDLTEVNFENVLCLKEE